MSLLGYVVGSVKKHVQDTDSDMSKLSYIMLASVVQENDHVFSVYRPG